MTKVERRRLLAYTGSRKGFIALLSVIAAGAVGLVLSVSLLTIGTSVAQEGWQVERSARARGLANACMEEALRQVAETAACEGSDAVTIGPDTCTFRTVPEGDAGCAIETTGTAGTSVRHVRATLTQTEPPLVLTTYREVAGF